MYQPPTTPQPIAQILDQGIALYKYSFWALLPLMMLFSFTCYLTYILAASPSAWNPLLQWVREHPTAYTLGQYGLMGILGMAIGARLQALLDNTPLDSTGALHQALQKTPLYLPILIALIWLINTTPCFSCSALALGLLLGLSLLGLYGLPLPALILRHTSPKTLPHTLALSFRLMWGQTWRLLLTLAVPAFLFSALFSTLLIVLTLFFSDETAANYVSIELFKILFQAFVLILFGGYLWATYLLGIQDLYLRYLQGQSS